MNRFIIPLFLTSIPVLSAEFKDDPYAIFDLSKRIANSVQVEIHTDENASEVCQKESRRRGFGGWPYKVYACTFWHGNKCSIYVPTHTNMHQLGHEFRHCLQANYHP